MGRISQRGETALYKELRKTAVDKKARQDCSVVAIAVVCGVDYEAAEVAITNAGRRMNTGATIREISDACRALGFGTEHVSKNAFINKYPGVHINLQNVTTHHPDRFKQVWQDGHTYLLYTRSHVAAVINGENHDWTKGRAKRVTNIYRVLPL